jgi:threonylcarbamoyladenosine tRNA methylthiotransferase MtaB
MKTKTVKFYTLGCKVNQYDTQVIREQFLKADFKELDNTNPADIYVINTCTVTHKADAESFGFIRKAKRENSTARIIVTGCLTELDADKIKRVCSDAIIVKKGLFPLDKGLSPPELIYSFSKGTVPKINGISFFKGHTRAFLKIQDGCNNFCSYCKVPLVRPGSKSKPLKDILQEAGNLAQNGYKEIVLCGICLGSYGKDLSPMRTLVEAVEAIEKIDGILRIRLSSIEPQDVTDELIDKMANSGKLCRHLHIPLQSGDDDILKKMNRKYRSADYLALIKKIKHKIPELAITTDVLAGFPGESETNFKHTLDLIKEILPLKVHIFPYSNRSITYAACNFKDEVNPRTTKERIRCLDKVSQDCALTFKKQFLNKTLPVLIEGFSRENPAFCEGLSDNYMRVFVKSSQDLKNELVFLNLKKIEKNFIEADFG